MLSASFISPTLRESARLSAGQPLVEDTVARPRDTSRDYACCRRSHPLAGVGVRSSLPFIKQREPVLRCWRLFFDDGLRGSHHPLHATMHAGARSNPEHPQKEMVNGECGMRNGSKPFCGPMDRSPWGLGPWAPVKERESGKVRASGRGCKPRDDVARSLGCD